MKEWGGWSHDGEKEGPFLRNMTQTTWGSELPMAAIIQRLNAIGDNPLCRNEVAELRRAYTAAVVRYFDDGRTTNDKRRTRNPGAPLQPTIHD